MEVLLTFVYTEEMLRKRGIVFTGVLNLVWMYPFITEHSHNKEEDDNLFEHHSFGVHKEWHWIFQCTT